MSQKLEAVLDWFFSMMDDSRLESTTTKWLDTAHLQAVGGELVCQCELHRAMHAVLHLLKKEDKVGILEGTPWIQVAFFMQVEDFLTSTWPVPPDILHTTLVLFCRVERQRIIDEHHLQTPDEPAPSKSGQISVAPFSKLVGLPELTRLLEAKMASGEPKALPGHDDEGEGDESDKEGEDEDSTDEDSSSDSDAGDEDDNNGSDSEDDMENDKKDPNGNPITTMPAGVTFFKKGVKVEPPPGVTYAQMIATLERQAAEEEQTVSIRERIDAFVLEGAVAFQAALKEEFGWVQKGATTTDTPSFFAELFGTPPKRPVTMIPVQTSLTTTEQVIWDQVRMAGVDGFLKPGFEFDNGRFFFTITGEVKRKHEGRVRQVVATTRRIVQESSIYKGHALEIDLPTDDELDVLKHAPRFMKGLDAVDPRGMIFTRKLEEELETYVFNIIRNTELLAKLGISAHRGALFMGPPGTGKSLAAAVTAKVAEENGWTFFYLKKPDQLVQTYKLASQYGDAKRGALLFVEDIDQEVLDEGEEDEVGADAQRKFRELLNTLDGIDTKGAQVFVIFTTNKDPRRFDPTFTRESRLDSTINFTMPDQDTAARLLRWYLSDRLDPTADITSASAQLAGLRPVSIKEVAAKAVLSAARRLPRDSDLNNLPTGIVNGADLDAALRVSKEQLALAKPLVKEMEPDSEEERAAVFLGTHIERAASTITEVLERFLPADRRPNGHSTKAIEDAGSIPALGEPSHTS